MQGSPCSPCCQQQSMLWSLEWASGPWAIGSALVCSAGYIDPVVKFQMWSVSSIRAWTGCRWRPNGPIPGCTTQKMMSRDWSEHGVLLGAQPQCLVVVVSQSCLPRSRSSLDCTLNKLNMLDSRGLCKCQCSTLLCFCSFYFIWVTFLDNNLS